MVHLLPGQPQVVNLSLVPEIPGQPQVEYLSLLTVRFYILSELGSVINATTVSQILNDTFTALAAALNQTQLLLAGK